MEHGHGTRAVSLNCILFTCIIKVQLKRCLIKVCQVKQKCKIDPSACVGTGAEICNGCMFTVYKRFWKIRLESKWNMPFLGRSSRKFPGATEHLKS